MQVIVANLLLVVDAALGDAFAQQLDRRLQVNHQVRARRVERQVRVDLLVQRQFVRVRVSSANSRSLSTMKSATM